MFHVTILSDDRKWTLLSIVFGWTLLFGTRLIYPVLVEYIRADFDISNSIVGLLFTIILLTYSLMQFPSGMLSDRIGERTILLTSLVLTLASCVLLTTAPTFVLFAVGCVAFGLGSGLYSTPQFSILTKVFPDQIATAHGIAFAAGGVGTALPIIAGVIAVQYDWRLGFGFVIPALLVTSVGVYRLVPSQGGAGFSGPPFRERLGLIGRSVNERVVILPFLATMMVAFTFQGLTAFLPTYLIDVKQFSSIGATVVYGLFFVAGTGFQVVVGVLADRYSQELSLITISLMGATALLSITVSDSVLFIALLVVPLSALNAFISLGNTYLMDTLPADIQGGGLGLLRTCIIGVGSTASVAVGYLADLGLFTEAFVGCSVVMFVAAVLSVTLYYIQ